MSYRAFIAFLSRSSGSVVAIADVGGGEASGEKSGDLTSPNLLSRSSLGARDALHGTDTNPRGAVKGRVPFSLCRHTHEQLTEITNATHTGRHRRQLLGTSPSLSGDCLFNYSPTTRVASRRFASLRVGQVRRRAPRSTRMLGQRDKGKRVRRAVGQLRTTVR